jgi:hypothetical protein
MVNVAENWPLLSVVGVMVLSKSKLTKAVVKDGKPDPVTSILVPGGPELWDNVIDNGLGVIVKGADAV